MASIARIPLHTVPGHPVDWAELAACVQGFLVANACSARDAVVLLPMVQHLPLARRAWMRLNGWMPRIETAQTLAQSLAPKLPSEDGQLSFDVGTDRLAAAALLREQAWAADWPRRDPRSFDEAVGALVSTAHALARAAAAVAPHQRDVYWIEARAVVPLQPGPGGTERALARIALEWAAASATPATDALFALKPSAWVVVSAGGDEAFVNSLLAAAPEGTVCALIDADMAVDETMANAEAVSLAACDGFEEEAQCAAAQVLDDLVQGRTPVALIAEDRVLVRRVRALLERHGVPLLDETGWKLSTTRAGALLMNLLRAAPAHAPTDAVMDWLKSTPTVWPGLGDTQRARAEIEVACRRSAWRQRGAIQPEKLSPSAATMWAQADIALTTLGATRRQPLRVWVNALRCALQTTGSWDALLADAAGQQVMAALRLSDDAGSALTAHTAMTLDEWVAWMGGVLEEASFIPPPPRQEAVVVITPMARVALRPFASVVLPGADERHLGAAMSLHPLLNDAQAVALGLPGSQQRHANEALHFAHALSAPRVSLFYRRIDGSEPLAVSPLLERLRLVRERAGRHLSAWFDPRTRQTLTPTPVTLPAPSAAGAVPQQMSASACEALRACPYRFHALHVLALREPDELDAEAAKRDYGTWLHAVLHVFHSERQTPAAAEVEVKRLHEIALAQQAEHGLDDADFLPFAASFEQLAPSYITWLHARDNQGAMWWLGEAERRITPAELQGLTLKGVIDRVDHIHREGATGVELIDYKTGNAEALKKQVKQPFEDTQLAFYAALMQAESDQPLFASYLALDGSQGIEAIAHPEVEVSADALLTGLAHDLERLRAGVGLPALGEGRVCEFCAARGLCRKDQWTDRP